MAMPVAVSQRVEQFERNLQALKDPSYKEAEVRREFVDPFFKALGWDIDNERGYAEPYKEVIHEARLKIGGGTKAPDYCFRVGTEAKFYVEAKKPSVNLKHDPSSAYQLRRYAWSKGLPISILTDFEEFVVYDTTVEPIPGDSASVARLMYFTYEGYEEHWNEIAAIFSRDAVWQGSFDVFAKPKSARRGSLTVDRAFLRDLKSWRQEIATDIAANNQLQEDELSYAVQQILDRVIFLRIAEDRGIEAYGDLEGLLKAKKGETYKDLLRTFRRADSFYNSGLFHFRSEPGRSQPDKLTPSLAVGDEVLKTFVRKLYYPYPYEFSVLPADILGQVYEQFLGTVIHLSPTGAVTTTEKPEVKKAGGIVYTPTYIVDYIVANALDPFLAGSDPERLRRRGLSIVDPACGSGTFLLQAYQRLLDWHLDHYERDLDRWKRSRPSRIYESSLGVHKLTTIERKRILTAYIYGVDIDPQAVEVTKLSLLLKVLEGETSDSLDAQLQLFANERALPDLGENIQSGNALVGTDLDAHVQRRPSLAARERVRAFDWQAAFPTVFAGGRPGFDVVIANPPYVLLQADFRDPLLDEYFRSRYKVARFKLDTYHLFIERSVELAAKSAGVAMIVPSNFLTNNYLDRLRSMLLDKTSIEEVLVIDGGVFEGRSVDNAILTVRAGVKTTGRFDISYATVSAAGKVEPYSALSISASRVRKDPYHLFTGGDDELAEIWLSMASRKLPFLGSVASVSFGKQLRDRTQYPDDVIRLAPGGAVPKGYRKCYSGEDVSRYMAVWSGFACLESTVAQKGGTWDPSIQNAKGKLLTRQIGRSPAFALDTDGLQVLNNTFMVIPKADSWSPEALLAILNSRLLEVFWIDGYWDRRRTFPKIKGAYLKRLPIPKAEKSLDDQLREMVQERIEVEARLRAARTPAAGTSARRGARQLDDGIDAIVEEAYGLSSGDRSTVARKASDLADQISKVVGQAE